MSPLAQERLHCALSKLVPLLRGLAIGLDVSGVSLLQPSLHMLMDVLFHALVGELIQQQEAPAAGN